MGEEEIWKLEAYEVGESTRQARHVPGVKSLRETDMTLKRFKDTIGYQFYSEVCGLCLICHLDRFLNAISSNASNARSYAPFPSLA